MREAVFDILVHSPRLSCPLQGARVLDLYAGSGAYGLEALSRGAAHATFVELDRKASGLIGSSVSALKAFEVCTVLTMDAKAAVESLARQKSVFDLVFIDPPYGSESESEGCLSLLTRDLLLSTGACLVVERKASSRQKEPETPKPLVPVDEDGPARMPGLVMTRRWGETEVVFLRHG